MTKQEAPHPRLVDTTDSLVKAYRHLWDAYDGAESAVCALNEAKKTLGAINDSIVGMEHNTVAAEDLQQETRDVLTKIEVAQLDLDDLLGAYARFLGMQDNEDPREARA